MAAPQYPASPHCHASHGRCSNSAALCSGNAPFVEGGGIIEDDIIPDSTTVVYESEQELAGVRELYAVPITGGTPIKLNLPLVCGGNISFALFTADSATVVYSADQDTDEAGELYAVSINGLSALSSFDLTRDDVISPADAIFVVNRVGETVN